MSFLDKILYDSYFGDKVLELFDPILREIHPIVPGDIFPAYFLLEYFQRPLIASIVVAMVAAFLGTFLLIRNLALLGDGIAHVSFGGIAIGLAFGGIGPLWYALVFSTFAAIVIDQLQTRNLISGDASIAIFLTGTLGLGLVILRVYGGAPQSTVDSYLWGSLNLIDRDSFDFVLKISILGYVSLVVLYQMLLSISIDPISARVQGCQSCSRVVFQYHNSSNNCQDGTNCWSLACHCVNRNSGCNRTINWQKFSLMCDFITSYWCYYSSFRYLLFSRKPNW